MKKDSGVQSNEDILAFFDSVKSDNVMSPSEGLKAESDERDDDLSNEENEYSEIKDELDYQIEVGDEDFIESKLADFPSFAEDKQEKDIELLSNTGGIDLPETSLTATDKAEQPALFSVDENGFTDELTSRAEIRWNNIIEDLMREKRVFEISQSYLTARERVSWETFLVLQLFGKVAYLTGGQVLRFLEAWRGGIDPEINFKPSILQNLISRGWVERIEQPLEFRKGVLKGRTIQPFYLTVKGFKYLQKEDVVTARLARFGKPKPKMQERLRHEVLISEVYVHLFEQGHYVVVILPEEELRRERIQSFWRQKTGREMPGISYRGIGDFRILYFDREQNKIISRDGEVAVRYTRNQILEKSGDLWWFCYDVVEAEKIEYITGQKPTVLTEKIFGSAPKRERKSTKPEGEKEKLLREWSEVLGGLTIQAAAYLAGVHYNTAKKMLDSRDDLKAKFTWLQPGSGAGRGTKLFVKDRTASDSTAHHLTLVKNMAIQYLYENGFEVRRKGSEFKAYDRKEKAEYALVFDAGYYRMGDNWTEIIEDKRREIERAEAQGARAIFAVGEAGNAEVYRKRLPQCTIISLSEYEFSYRK